MKKKLTAAVAGVLAATMVFGTSVFAANSPSTSKTEVKASTTTESAAPAAAVNAYIPRTSGGYQAVEGVRFQSDYSSVTDSKAVATSYKADAKDAATVALEEYVAASSATGKTFGPYKLRMYKAGKAVWNGFGTFKYSVGVGNKYDGQTATVFQIHQDGSVTTTQVTVVNGKVNISVEDMGTFMIKF